MRSIGVILLVMEMEKWILPPGGQFRLFGDGFLQGYWLPFPKSKIFAGYNLTYLSDNDSYDVGAVNGAFMMCPRRALLRFGVFDEQFFMYGDDLDLCYRCKSRVCCLRRTNKDNNGLARTA